MKLLAIALSVFVAGCDAGTPEPPPTNTTSTAADGLTLRVASPERIAGTYVDPTTGIGVVFESARAADTLYLHVATLAGKELLHAETDASDYVFRYMDGALTLRVAKAWVAQVHAEGDGGPAAADETAARWTGDREVLDAMLAL
ncbi:MAG TPA: hypothetical protein VK427_10010, partial [Kofleriaceae bacterium]|nr:hypothetical protein [Kofleriaceae bacterium]